MNQKVTHMLIILIDFAAMGVLIVTFMHSRADLQPSNMCQSPYCIQLVPASQFAKLQNASKMHCLWPEQQSIRESECKVTHWSIQKSWHKWKLARRSFVAYRYTIFLLLSGMWNIDEQCRNPNSNSRDHLVGRLTDIIGAPSYIFTFSGRAPIQ